MTNCIYCKTDVEKEDVCKHRHGAHKSCCSKNNMEFLNYVRKQFRPGISVRFQKETLHANYYDF